MILLRRFGGILLILMGAAGVVACGVAIYKTGNAEKQLRRFAGQTFDSTGNTLLDIRERLNQINLSVVHVRSDLKTALSKANALRTDGIDEKILADHITFALDHEVGEKLAKTQRLVDDAVNTAGSVSHFLTLLDASSLVSVKAYTRGGSLMNRIEGASNTLRRLSGMLEQARQTARALLEQTRQNHPDSEQALSNLTHEVEEMDKGLAEVQVLGSDFKEDVQEIENRLRHYEEKTIWWIHLGGILIPLLLIWLGAGQMALIILGGRLCMRR
jgi:ABC-type multidrug transport system fused ATPase/permease subunit